MADVNHNSMYYMTHEDHVAIATYLKSVKNGDPIGLPPSSEPPNLQRGQLVYRHACILCHQNGQMSAPLLGDPTNWADRLRDNGLKALYDHVIKGYNSMPIRGACVTCSDDDIIASVDYVLNESLTRSQKINLLGKKNVE